MSRPPRSAGKRKSGKTRHGDRWLTGALGTAALAAARTRDSTYLGAKYRRLAPRIGKQKAIVALQHSILAAVWHWHMFTDDVDYQGLGGDYFARLDPERPCAASCAKPMPSDTPYGSTPSKPLDHQQELLTGNSARCCIPRRCRLPTHLHKASHPWLFSDQEHRELACTTGTVLSWAL